MNLLEVSLIILGSLRHVFVSYCDTTALPSLVVWLAINTAELPKTPMLLCGLFFS